MEGANMTLPTVIQLGDTARDTITGFEGVVIGISEWLYGCRRMIIQSKGLNEGKPIESQSFDEPQLVLVSALNPPQPVAATGGPRPTPTRGR
jgi:hypothetical protein